MARIALETVLPTLAGFVTELSAKATPYGTA